MKRPATLVLVATLLASGSAFAARNDEGLGNSIKREIVRSDNGNRGNDGRNGNNRGNDRGNSQRNDSNRGNSNHSPPLDRSNGRRDDRRDDHRDDRRDGGRHDWNDNRNDHDRNDHRNDRNNHGNDRNNWNGHRGWDRPRNDWQNHPNYWDNRRHDRRDYARYRYHFGFYRPPLGYSYRMWHRGDRLPLAYYGRSYIVYDWHPYRLYAPPYGYHWVRVGNDVLLTAIATGVVLDVLYDIWY